MKKKREFRPATLDERKKFYETEFSIKKVKKWFKKNNLPTPQLCAIDTGTETGITLKKEWKNTLFYFPFNKLEEKIKKYCPEDVYYDRNIYTNPNEVLNTLKFETYIGQQLVFDIDLDNLRGKKNQKINSENIKRAYGITKKMVTVLKNNGFKKMQIVYSGRGFHIHVFDKKAFTLRDYERKKLNKTLKEFPIDPWVSAGHIRLIRMPYSLHGMISRKVIPIMNSFNETETIPEFLGKNRH
ncbi:DNA primase small subunit PriS [uncultured archaeon]|nr:DNA primase small subunit PriS [uncultured archaeon]